MKFTLTMLIIFAAGIGALEWGQQHADAFVSRIGGAIVFLTLAGIFGDLALHVRRSNLRQKEEDANEQA